MNMVTVALDQVCLDQTGHVWWFLAESRLNHGILGLVHAHPTMDGARNHNCTYAHESSKYFSYDLPLKVLHAEIQYKPV